MPYGFKNCYIVELNDTQRKMSAYYSTPASGANGYIYKRHSTISYIQLTSEFTSYYGGLRCGIAKRSKISPNINQLIKSTIEVFNYRLFMALSQSIW